MARVIVKNGAVAVSGGRVVTDAGGAPCCCGPGGARCSSRVEGSCWKISFDGIQINTNYHNLAAFNASGGGSSTVGVTDCGAFGNPFGPLNVISASGFNKEFLAKYRTSGRVAQYRTFTDHFLRLDLGGPTLRDAISLDVVCYLWCGDELNEVYDADPDRYSYWGQEPFDPQKVYVLTLFCNLWPGGASNPPFYPSFPFFFNSTDPRTAMRPVEVGTAIPNDDTCFDTGNPTRRVSRGFLGGTATVTLASADPQASCETEKAYAVAAKCVNPLATISVDASVGATGDESTNCYYNGELYTITTESTQDDPVDVEWTADECPTQSDEWPVAIECGGQGSITFDPATRPPNGVTIQVGDTIYVPTVEVSQDQPTAGAWLPDPCPDGNDIYQISFCRSSQAANQTFSFDPDTNGLRSQTVGYRPGNGLQPGEGHVFIQLPGAAGCLTQVAATPTDIPLSTEPEVVLTSRPGTCRGLPSVVVDPRSQCQQTDGGGGGTIPDSPNLTALPDLTDTGSMGLGDAVERAIKTITLNQLATCPACQRRKEVLNQFGLTVGRAVLRRLGW